MVEDIGRGHGRIYVYVCVLDAWSAIAISSKPHKLCQRKCCKINCSTESGWRQTVGEQLNALERVRVPALIDVNYGQTPINAHACTPKTIAGFSCLKS